MSDTIPATVGWDAASGLGSIRGKVFADTVVGSTPTPPTPPTPPPTPTPGGPTLAQVLAAVNAEFKLLEANNPWYRTLLMQLNQIIDQTITSVWHK